MSTHSICFMEKSEGVCSVRKEFAPKGCRFCPFRVDPFPFQKVGEKQVYRVASPKRYQFPFRKNIQLDTSS